MGDSGNILQSIKFNSFDRNDYVIMAAMAYSDNDVKILAR